MPIVECGNAQNSPTKPRACRNVAAFAVNVPPPGYTPAFSRIANIVIRWQPMCLRGAAQKPPVRLESFSCPNPTNFHWRTLRGRAPRLVSFGLVAQVGGLAPVPLQ